MRATHGPGPVIAAAISVLFGAMLAPSLPSEDGSGIASGRPGTARKAIVDAGPRVRELIDRGELRLLEEYAGGERLLVQERSAPLLAPGAARLSAGQRPILDRIVLRARTIDTTAAAPALLAPSTPRGRLEIVQFHGPVKGEWLSDLTRGDQARAVAYVPHNAYIVWIEDPVAASFSNALQWREPLRTSDRLSPELISTAEPISVTVQIVRFGDHAEALSEVRSRALEVLMEPAGVGPITNIRARLHPDDLVDLAERPEVLWIEPFSHPVPHDEKSAVIAAGFTADSKPGAPGYARWLAAHGLSDLSGLIVDVTDTGLDAGGTDVGHPGLRGRVVYSLNMASDDPGDCAGHGTNVAGILAGAPVPGNILTDDEGYLLGLGVAPSLRIGATKIFDCSGQIVLTRPFSEIVAGAYELGARIGNNSWGGAGSNYNSVDAEYDAIVRDVNQDPGDGEQAFLPVFSVGNEGPTAYSIGWPATAKNVLSVGASEGYRPGFTDGCGTLSTDSDSVDHVAVFSSRGPTGDGRIKPDIVAPGSHIHSLASTDLSYKGFGVCNPYLPLGQTLVNLASGTSQAAPHVTGAAAIASEIYRREHGVLPSPAMIKAILLGHAHDMGFRPEAPSNTDNRPNFQQGWGRLDIGSIVTGGGGFASDQRHVMTATGEIIRFEPLVVDDITAPVTVTLVWSDAPGTPIASPWVNDLDLKVDASGAVYLGNVFNDGLSITGGDPDFRNNVERVVLRPGVRELSISVEAANIAGDGVPAGPSSTDQDFAIYVGNARLPDGNGQVLFTRDHARCGSDVTVRVLDRDLRGLGSSSVTLESGTDTERLALREEPPGTGAFQGSMAVLAAPPGADDGRLQTSDGLQVTALYRELDHASGELITREASVPARCEPLEIGNVRVSRVGDAEAEIRWTTDRRASSRVSYGLGSSRTQSREDSKLVTDHSVRLTGLKSCAYHTATVTSMDETGSSTGPATPLAFSTGPGSGRRRAVFRDDMEGIATRWSHHSVMGGLDDWELGFPGLLFPAPASGLAVWGTNLDGHYRVGADSVLVSPPIDLRDTVAPELTFRHVFSITGGRTPSSFNDGGWVEVSTDSGQSWSVIVPPEGYTDTIDEDNPHLPDQSGVYAGIQFAWREVRFDLSGFVGNVVLIRFHIWQDSGENNATSFGWLIDDVEVTAESSCHRGLLRVDAEEYGCSSTADVILSDSHLDVNPSVVETVEVTASSASGSIPVLLTETLAHSGEFAGRLRLGSHPSPGRLLVEEGETFVIQYSDNDVGNGTAGLATVSAQVSDCTPPPPPTEVRIAPAGDGRLSITWSPVDPDDAPDLQGYRVHYDTDGPGPVYSGSGAMQGPSPVRTESQASTIGLDSLGPCATHFITVSAFDRLGNESAFAPEVIGMAGAAAACNQALLQVDREAAGCRQTVTVTVSDANADPDPSAPGSVIVTLSGPSHPGPMPFSLRETGNSTGVFIGTPLLSPTGGGGFQVSEGETMTVVYEDADDGLGGARTAGAAVEIVDCRAPGISDIRITGRSESRSMIRWSTDEPSTSEVRYGPDESLGLVESDPLLATDHAVLLDSGLTSCSTVHFTVFSTDMWLNTAVADDGGRPLSFGTFRAAALADDDFESGVGGWTHQAFDSTDEWELGPPVPGVTGGPPAAFSGTNVWGTDLDGLYERDGDMRLVSPPIDLSGRQSASLRFKHWVDLYTSGSPNGLDDGAFIEVSLDDGQTWSYIEPDPSTPYNDTIGPNPYTPFAAGVFSGRTNAWTDAVFPLDDFVGEEIRIGFHLYQDRLGGNPLTGAGWYIDDALVSFGAACRDGVVDMDRSEYRCSGDSAIIRLSDLDLDLDPLVRETASVLVTSGGEPSGEIVLLLETGPGTGVFEGELALSAVDDAGTLLVGSRDSIVVSYEDADDGTGAPSAARATAVTLECSAPVISDVAITEVMGESFRVEWTTSVPSDSRVHYGSDASLDSEAGSAALTTAHSVTVDGLEECSEYFFTLSSTNEAGITTREDASRPLRTIMTHNTVTLMTEDFETGASGWKHAGQGDTWRIDSVSGDMAAATAIGSDYLRPPGDRDSNFVLTSPPINLVGVQNPILTFNHSYDFEPSLRGGDGGWVEAWNGSGWVTLVPEGGYPGTISEEASPTGTRFGGFAGQDVGSAIFDLSALGSRLIRLRFHVFIRSGTGPTGEGWMVDDLAITGLVDCRGGRLAFEAESVSCAAVSVPLTLSDRDLDGDPSQIDQVAVSVEAASTGSPIDWTLVETGPASGLFRGLVVFDPPGDDPVLPAVEGDTITATYLDADDGTGTPRTVAASIGVVNCDGPGIARFTPALSGDSILLRWATDRPATSEATLRTDDGATLDAADHRFVTSHALSIEGIRTCTAYTPTIASEDAHGNRSVTTGAPLESIRKTTLFEDDMEGPDPGWGISGAGTLWTRGVPFFGPEAAFSGQTVFGTDLHDVYEGGTNNTLTTPPIDLRGVSSARLTFWHWYEVFGKQPPNSIDDGAWVEVFSEGATGPTYIQPIQGYSDIMDSNNGVPMPKGTPAYAGRSNGWERADFDLTRFTGRIIRIRFRLWNNSLDLIINGSVTGAGWYLDDVEVWSPGFCHPAPTLAPRPTADLPQGGSATGLVVTGGGFRQGLVASLGAGIGVTRTEVLSPSELRLDIHADSPTRTGPRDLTVINPDGQYAVLASAVRVTFTESRADINESGRVDGTDLFLLAEAFGTSAGDAGYSLAADLDGNGFIDGFDLALLAASFGTRF